MCLNETVYKYSPFPVLSDTSLTITRVSKDQQGIYQCVARSPLGMTSSAALLQVKDQDEVEFTWPEVPDCNDQPNNNSEYIFC